MCHVVVDTTYSASGAMLVLFCLWPRFNVNIFVYSMVVDWRTGAPVTALASSTDCHVFY